MKNKIINRVISVVLVFAMAVLLNPFGTISVEAATNGITQEQAVEWAKAQASKPKDYDGAYGVQCVDLAVAYYKYLGEKSPGGNGRDYATNKLPSGWTRIKNSYGFVPNPGDIAVWTKTGSEYGHVAIVLYADLSTLTVSEFLGSNGTARTHTYSYSYGTFYGVIRPDFSNTPTVTTNSTNPDNYPACERDLVYNSTVETGNDVKWVQCILKHLGYSIDIDGSYGPSSRDVIKKFQSAYGLTVDGQCGPKTRAKLKEVWASKGHTWDSGIVVTAATHTSTGVKNHKCNYCEATKNETIAKLSGHTYGSWQNHSSTQHKKTCACGDIQYANHTWNSGTITKAATHTETGIKTYTCTGCNTTKTETIAKLSGHTYGAWQNHNSSQHKKSCACGDVQYANHTWNSGTVTTQPTCTATGVRTYTCTGCNATKTEPISAKGHSYSSWQNYSSSQHKKTCSCSDVQYANHTWNSGTITKAATHTEEGIKTYTCTGCNATKAEAIAKLSGHTYGDWVNYDELQHKRVCACGFYELSNHNWDNGIITTPATNTTEGIKTYTCSICNAKKTESVPNIESSDTAAKITVSNHEVLAGGTIKVTVSIKENPGVASLILKVAYDNSLLTLTNVEYNSAIGGQTVNPSDLNSPVTLYWINAFGNMSDDVVFATLTFKVNENAMAGASSNIVVSYNSDDIYNINEVNIPLDIQNGTVTIIDYVPGDINGDGILNNKDVTRLMQYCANWDVEVNEAALDVNNDGALNNKDVSRLMQYLAGWNVEIY